VGRHHPFNNVRPFFCQVEAVETAIWLTEVALQSKSGKRFLEHLAAAERRKLETHPQTGAAQLVELRETVREITVEKYVEAERPAAPKPALFANVSDDVLLGFGVPTEWLADVKQANEDGLLVLADHLPREAAEALRQLRASLWKRSIKSRVMGPGLPEPIVRLSTFTTGMTSAAVPVRNISSAM
jgi:hypothetical protein